MAARKDEKSVVVDGIEVGFIAGALEDIDVIETIADLNAPDATDMDKTRLTVELFRLVFGDEYIEIKAKLRDAKGGRLTADEMADFFNRACEAVGAKN